MGATNGPTNAQANLAIQMAKEGATRTMVQISPLFGVRLAT